MFLLFGIIMLQTLIHLIVQLSRFSGSIILSFDQSLDMFLKLIYMDFILFLSLLVLLYLALTSCYCTFVLFYCIFQQLDLSCYVIYYALLYCHHFLQFCVLFVHLSQLHLQVLLSLHRTLPTTISFLLQLSHSVSRFDVAVCLRFVVQS